MKIMKINEMKELAKGIKNGKQKTLKLQDKFQFKCTACGKCCFNTEILLNIYDWVRIRNALKLPTQEIIKKDFVNFYLGASSGLPILTINFQNIGNELTRCPFLAPSIRFEEILKLVKTKAKTKEAREKLLKEYKKNSEKLHKDLDGVKIERWLCAIHKHRPMVCRLFPLGRVKMLDEKGKLEKEVFILQNKNDSCHGWKQKHKYTLKSFLDECEFWHYKEGSDKSYEVLEKMMKSGFIAVTKDNKNAKPKPKFEKDSPVLRFLGNLIYNFDSINYFSKDKRVIKTIYEKSTHEDFMYVVEKINKVVDFFIKSYQKSASQGSFKEIKQFMKSINPK